MNLSICIVNWNVKDYLEDCLESIYNNTNGFSFEVIVVDNHSKDGSREMVKEKFPRVKLIENQRNLGFPAANNQAIRQSIGKHLLFLNPDTVILPGTIQGIVEFMDTHPDAGIASCRKVEPDGGQIQEDYHPFSLRFLAKLRYTFWNELAKKFPRNTIVKNRLLDSFLFFFNPKTHQNESPFQIDFVQGSFLMTRQEIFKQVGLFDQRFFHYGDDDDFCYRVRKQGWKVYFCPEFKIIHFIQKSMGQWDQKSQTDIKNFCSLLFYRKHKGKIKLFLWVIGRIILVFLIACVYLIFNLIPPKIKSTPIIKEKTSLKIIILSHIKNLFKVLMGISPSLRQYE